MADLTRAEELVGTIDQDAEFRAAIQAAPTVTAKRQLLDARGFQDVSLNVSDRPTEFPTSNFKVRDGHGRPYSFDDFAAIPFLIEEIDNYETTYQQLQPDVIGSTSVISDVPEDATGFTLTTTGDDFEAPLDRQGEASRLPLPVPPGGATLASWRRP